MTIADYVILAVVLLSGLIGLFRGFFREVLSIASWIVAAYVAFLLGPTLADSLADYISTPSVRLAGSYATLFIVVLIVGSVINYFVGKLVKGSGFAGTDKLLGLIFGGARGLIIVLIFIMLANISVISQDPWYQSSKVISYLSPWAEKMKELLPDDLDQHLSPDEPVKSGEPVSPAGEPASPESSTT